MQALVLRSSRRQARSDQKNGLRTRSPGHFWPIFGPAAFDGSKRWLAIAVEGEDVGPRAEITAVPQALFALRPWQTSGATVFYQGGPVGIGTATPASALSVEGSLDVSGQVGIGTASPGAALEVASGDIILTSPGADVYLADGTSLSSLKAAPAGAAILTRDPSPPEGYSSTGATVSTNTSYRIRPTLYAAGLTSDSPVAAVSGRIYVIDAVNSPRHTWEYNPPANSWSDRAPFPEYRTDAAAASEGSKLYLIGGRDQGGGAVGSVYAYDPILNTWSPRTPMPTPRSGAGTAVLNGSIYVMGGYTNGQPRADVEVYDVSGDSWTMAAPLPWAGLTDFNSFTANGQIHLLATGAGRVHLVYDPVDDSWAGRSEPLVYSGPATELGGRVYLQNASLTYDAQTDTWTTLPGDVGVAADAMLAIDPYIYLVDMTGVGVRIVRCTPPELYYVHVKD